MSSTRARSFGLRRSRGGWVDRPNSRLATTASQTPRPRTRIGARGRESRGQGTGASFSAQIICALTESRGVSAIVGMCFVNLSTGQCILCEICDSQTYVRTVHKLLVYDPTEILLPNTATAPRKSKLVSVIEENIPGAHLLEVIGTPSLVRLELIVWEGRQIPRRFYNEQTGHECLQKLAFTEDVEAIKVAISAKFYAVSAAAAALKYIEINHNTVFALGTLRIKYQASEGSMLIDFSTVHNLELVQNLKNSKSLDSLFGLLNNTLTPMGSRLLRSNILQPLTDVSTIQTRLDAVEEFTRHEEIFYSTRAALKQFLDLDRLLTALITIPAKATLKYSEQAINNVIILKQALGCVAEVSEALAGTRCELLVAIKDARYPELCLGLNKFPKTMQLCNPVQVSHVQQMIDEVINKDVMWAKSALDVRNQRCYAVKNGVNGLLDVARDRYKVATENVYSLVGELSETHNLPLELRYETGRGYYLRLPASALDREALPHVFVNVVERKKIVEFTTLELMKRNAKIEDSLTEVLMMSDETVQGLIQKIRKDVGALYRVAESVAMLDMIISFCHISTIQDYVRPEFTDTLAIKDGRHPLCEKIHKSRYVPNDIYASIESRFQIITGCNMSGKSTYVRSIALMSIMAQIGCFVPAQYASFPIVLQLFARVSTDDVIETNASTFAVEMRETAFILRNVGKGSMVIADELGRGTGSRDGLAIALAIAEALVESKAFVWFVTHFRELPTILADRPGVVNLHMQIEMTQEHHINMLYKIADGVSRENHYGLALAKLVELPEKVIKMAIKVSTTLAKQAEQRKLNSKSRLLAQRRKLVLTLRETLTHVWEGNMDDKMLGSFLSQIQEEFVLRMHELSLVDAGRKEQQLGTNDNRMVLSLASPRASLSPQMGDSLAGIS